MRNCRLVFSKFHWISAFYLKNFHFGKRQNSVWPKSNVLDLNLWLAPIPTQNFWNQLLNRRWARLIERSMGSLADLVLHFLEKQRKRCQNSIGSIFFASWWYLKSNESSTFFCCVQCMTTEGHLQKLGHVHRRVCRSIKSFLKKRLLSFGCWMPDWKRKSTWNFPSVASFFFLSFHIFFTPPPIPCLSMLRGTPLVLEKNL